eukprot:3932029-Rhodomonas_salina.1
MSPHHHTAIWGLPGTHHIGSSVPRRGVSRRQSHSNLGWFGTSTRDFSPSRAHFQPCRSALISSSMLRWTSSTCHSLSRRSFSSIAWPQHRKKEDKRRKKKRQKREEKKKVEEKKVEGKKEKRKRKSEVSGEVCSLLGVKLRVGSRMWAIKIVGST